MFRKYWAQVRTSLGLKDLFRITEVYNRVKTYRDINPFDIDENTQVGIALKNILQYEYMSTKFPFWVRFAENPKYSLFNRNILFISGAVHEETHDIIHLILARGFYPEDEAFVVGFTCGSTRKWNFFANHLYRFVSRYMYPREYRFNNDQLKIFELGIKAGEELSLIDLSKLPVKKAMKLTIKELRNTYIKDWEGIIKFYAKELDMLGNKITHARLKKMIK